MSDKKENGTNIKHSAETEPEYRLVQVDNTYTHFNGDDDEIDLIELIKTLWEGRRTIIITVLVFIGLGLFIALGSSEEFTSEVKMMPESRESVSGGSLGGLARQFGFGGLSSGVQSEGIPVNLYPDITKSLPLMRKLMNAEIHIPGQNTIVSLETYLTEMQSPSAVSMAGKYTIGLPFTILGWIRGSDDEEMNMDQEISLIDGAEFDQVVRMSTLQWEVVENLKERINASMDEQSGIVTISVIMPDAEVAAEVTQRVVGFLRDYITSYNTDKARQNVEFIESRYAESSQRFKEAQERLARYRDENRGQLTELARTREQNLQSEYDLAFNIHNAMAERLEEARIKLQEDTPVVKILEPVAVPDKRSEPRRPLIMVISAMLGGMLGVGIIFGRKMLQSIKNEWDN
ncbi:MAG: Wzz/FepE/Etk N-terminal domain-containing protein [Candidatus Paceibacterota bacterium]